MNVQEFCDEYKLEIDIGYHDENECPPDGTSDHTTLCPRGRCHGTHGFHYRPTLKMGRRRITFDFWGSFVDWQNGLKAKHRDVLEIAALGADMPIDPEEVLEEVGPMDPDQARLIANEAKRFEAFGFDEIMIADAQTLEEE